MKPDPAIDAAPKPKSRAKNAQSRSRETKEKIIKAALRLWDERGFEEGFEQTTVDEIADTAAVSRATVYYYFPKKEDILLEVGWLTGERIYADALRSLIGNSKIDDVLDEIMVDLGAKVAKSPPAAVNRMLKIQSLEPESLDRDSNAGGLSIALTLIFTQAREMNEIPKSADPSELGEILTSLCMGIISRWSMGVKIDLPQTLRNRAAFVLRGARAS